MYVSKPQDLYSEFRYKVVTNVTNLHTRLLCIAQDLQLFGHVLGEVDNLLFIRLDYLHKVWNGVV